LDNLERNKKDLKGGLFLYLGEQQRNSLLAPYTILNLPSVETAAKVCLFLFVTAAFLSYFATVLVGQFRIRLKME
jgi:hypothetical protein